MKHSASSIQTYLDCPTKWALIYRDGNREPSGESARYGTFLHAIMEFRRKQGHWPEVAEFEEADGTYRARPVTDRDLAILEEAFDKWGPYHAAGDVAEGRFEFRGRHEWRGIRDLRGPARVVDYKTTSDLKWAKSEDDLATDPQALLYAHTVAVEDNAAAVDLDWIYMRTRLPNGSKSVKLRVNREQAARGFEALEAIADLCEATTSSKDAPRNESACDKFNGCQFKGPGFCNISPFKQRSPDMSAAADLFKKMAQGRVSAGLPPTPAPLPAKPETAPMVGVPSPLLDSPPPGAVVTPDGAVVSAEFAARMATPTPSQARAAAAVALPAINPPAPASSTLVGAPAPAAQAPAATEPPPRIRRTKEEMALGLTAEQALARRAGVLNPAAPNGSGQPVVHPAVQMAADALRREAMAAASAPSSAGPQEEVDLVSRKPAGDTSTLTRVFSPEERARELAAMGAAAPKVHPADPTDEGLKLGMLYVGCTPLRGAVVHLDAAIAHARVQIAKQGCADWRLVEYGKGKAYLIEHVIAYLAKTPGADVVALPGDEAAVVLPYLRAAARDVVQGVAA